MVPSGIWYQIHHMVTMVIFSIRVVQATAVKCPAVLKKIRFLSNRKENYRSDSCPFDFRFDPNGIPFGSNRKEIGHYDHSIQSKKNLNKMSCMSVPETALPVCSVSIIQEQLQCINNTGTTAVYQ